MIDERYIELVTAYIEDSLSTRQRIELNELIEQGTIDLLDLKEMELIYRRLGTLPQPEPNPQMRERFYSMLSERAKEEEQTIGKIINIRFQQLLNRISPRNMAAALALFIAGLLIGDLFTPLSNRDQRIDRLSQEVSQMREVMMVTLMDNESPIERLKAVNISNEIREADREIIDALLKTLNHDPNVNVRVAAVEALVRHGDRPQVRKGLIDAIGRQESPVVQSSLADAMLNLQEKRSVKAFQKLLEKNGLHTDLRDKLENTIAALN
ncbi:MAG: HEAT repeat domain-containing protein [Balneolaceae bacterium]|nr:HEAT repeat domain-containing protein [Balneolaceae bacterium]